MRCYRLLFAFLLILFTNNGFSQGTVGGCLLPDNKVYTFQGLLGFYSSATSISLSSNYCSWTPSTGSPCQVCNGPLNGLGTCLIGTYTDGMEGTFTMVQCNLDDYYWTLGAVAGAFGVLAIKRRKNTF